LPAPTLQREGQAVLAFANDKKLKNKVKKLLLIIEQPVAQTINVARSGQKSRKNFS